MTASTTISNRPGTGLRPMGLSHDAGKPFPGLSASHGFTIIEIIVTITIAAIMGSIAIQFSGTSLSMSASTVTRIKHSYQLNEAMEKITRDYRSWLEDSPAEPISEFETAVKADYGAYVDAANTGTDSSYFIEAGDDVTIDLLHLTLTDGTQSLVAVFTK